jgi:hypothetical protein
MPEKESEFVGNLVGAKLLICRKVIGWLILASHSYHIIFNSKKMKNYFYFFKSSYHENMMIFADNKYN